MVRFNQRADSIWDQKSAFGNEFDSKLNFEIVIMMNVFFQKAFNIIPCALLGSNLLNEIRL